VCSKSLEKKLETVKYVKESKSRMKKKIKERIERVGGVDTSASLCLDVPTRFELNLFDAWFYY